MMQIERLGDPARLNAAIAYDESTGSIGLKGNFTGVKAGELALLDPRLSLLRGFVMTFDGSVATSFNADGRLGDSKLELEGGAGTATLLGQLDTPLRVQRAHFAGTLNANNDTLTLDDATITLDGPVLKATGTLTAAQEGLMQQNGAGYGPDMQLSMHMVATNIPVGPLGRYWPRNAGRIRASG